MDNQNNKFKLADKAFSRLLITSLSAIFACIICLCSTTYAWFTQTLPSKNNTIQVAEDCLLEVTVEDENGAVLANIEEGVELQAGIKYTVTLTLPKDTGSGYCLISDGENTYYTDYILRHTDDEIHMVSFWVMVEETKEIKFTPRWGIYNRESDVVDDSLIIP